MKYLLIILALISIVALYFTGRVPQSVQYHQFADTDVLFGIPHFHNVLSNLPFLFIGLMGISYMKRNSYSTLLLEKIIYSTVFLGLILLCFGSIYYHSDPNNFTMVWDRLPMTLIFSSLFSIIVWDFVDRKSGRWTFIILLPAGILSVFYWWYSEIIGMGDLRPYIFIQFFPIICLPLILAVSPKNKNISVLGKVLIFYVLAKIFELYDGKIYEFLGYSGHSIKHIFAAISTYYIYKYMKKRVKIHI